MTNKINDRELMKTNYLIEDVDKIKERNDAYVHLFLFPIQYEGLSKIVQEDILKLNIQGRENQSISYSK